MRTFLILSLVGLGLLTASTARAQFGYVPHTTTHYDVVPHRFHHDVVPHTTTHFDRVPVYQPSGFQASFNFSRGFSSGFQSNYGYQSSGYQPSYGYSNYNGGGHGYVPHTTTHFDAVPHGNHHDYVPHTTTHFDPIHGYGHR